MGQNEQHWTEAAWEGLSAKPCVPKGWGLKGRTKRPFTKPPPIPGTLFLNHATGAASPSTVCHPPEGSTDHRPQKGHHPTTSVRNSVTSGDHGHDMHANPEGGMRWRLIAVSYLRHRSCKFEAKGPKKLESLCAWATARSAVVAACTQCACPPFGMCSELLKGCNPTTVSGVGSFGPFAVCNGTGEGGGGQ